MSEWWVNFFDDVYGDLILHTFDAKEIKESVTFIVNEFSINKETRIYDQCCGKGSMSLPLLEKTPHIYGCDIIPSYIKAIQSQTSKGKFIAADAREYRPDEDMDIIINWHTSFGYSKNHLDNVKMLEAAYESLKKGGVFLMEYINFEYVIKNFKKTIIQEKDVNGEHLTVIRDCFLEDGMLKQNWTIKEKPDWEKFGETKIYFEDELVTSLKDVGFKNIEVFFSLKEENNTKIRSPKLYVLAFK